MDLYTRTYEALLTPLYGQELNKLLQDLAENLETDALIRVWDTKLNNNITHDTWNALIKLHNMGKGKIPSGTIHPPTDRRRLDPVRRLHKICKGKTCFK